MAKVIMIQGTMSSAGKSFLTAGLCRIFKQDGYRVAPFKSQNMALNSYITAAGLEMGRAQVMQAEAAGIFPEVSMNPVLLKPTSHMGSQLIVNGKVRGNFAAAEYFKMKKSLIPDIEKAYGDLASRFDIIVVEGAGSPAEINLRKNDIVNMGLAEILDAPVLLAGDIDRGGVFAQLYGTAALLTEQERKRIKAFIINKFRGDKEILKPGLSMLYDRIPIPVAGVVPYMEVDLDDEDSLADRLNRSGSVSGKGTDKAGNPAFAKISVLRLPRISNFTDFNALERLPGISLNYVTRPEELGGADLVILPGTKNTMGDLKWIRQNGLEAAVLKLASEGAVIFGVCGGYQMLGESLCDPFGVEEGGILEGMGLLPVKTEFLPEKTRTRMDGNALAFGGAAVSGYEIHMGNTIKHGGSAFSVLRGTGESAEPGIAGGNAKGKEDGCVFQDVYGTYLHGVFDTESMQRAVWNLLAEKNGVETGQWETFDGFSVDDYKEKQYDLLADILRENLDMEMIYRILNREI